MTRSPSGPSRLRRHRLAAVAALFLVAVGLGGVGPAVAEPPKDPVGPVRLVQHAVATDVNNQGVVVGWQDLADGRHAFRWSRGQVTDLGPGRAEAVNDTGVVVGEREGRATRWDPDGTPHDLGAGQYSAASDINDRGTVVGWFYVEGHGRGFVLEPGAEAPEALPPSPATLWVGDFPEAINSRGTIVGMFIDDFNPRAIVWRAGTHEPEVLPETAPTSIAQGINERGTIVGTTNDVDGSYKAVIWRAGDHQQVEVGEPGSSSLGRGINARGQVVGVQYTTGRAYRWDPASGTTTILPDLGDGYAEATAINDGGVAVGSSSATDAGPMFAVMFGS
jgi:probable HAF family extracellular repeat protein